MMIDSRITSTPSVVFALLVTYRVGARYLRRCDVDLSTWNTDVKDDLPWSLRDGMDGRLRKELRYSGGRSSGN